MIARGTRIHLHLHVSSAVVSLPEITGVVGAAPTRTEAQGTRRQPFGPWRKENRWELDLGETANAKGVRELLSALTSLGEKVAEGLGRLVATEMARVSLHIVQEVVADRPTRDYVSLGALVFDPEVIAWLGRAGASVDPDQYFVFESELAP